MAITQAIANNFKKLLLEGDASFKQTGGDKFKLALYTSSATLTSATTSLLTSAPTHEVTSSNYSAGGGALVNNPTSLTAGVARADFADLSFQNVTLTARGALIYNTSSATTNSAVCVLDFGGDKTATSGTFTVQFPAPTSTAAILRISG
jgi:hypothetical protein|tara:strand:- start:1369 stop:1815 length:447 start_codon:yes stop_codon:yes gene_type:complete